MKNSNLQERHLEIAGIPTLAVGGGGPYRGTVLFLHGLGASKETHRKELYSLAGRGFLALGLDAVEHGARGSGEIADRLGMLSVIMDTAEEIPAYLEAVERLQPDCGPFGLVGISMGGCIAFAASANFYRFQAVVPLLACPDWSVVARQELPRKLWQESPHLTPEWYNPTALLVQNAGRDQHVPCEPARRFVEEAKLYYNQYPERLQYVEHPRSDHFMEPDEWEQLWERTLEWLERYLSS